MSVVLYHHSSIWGPLSYQVPVTSLIHTEMEHSHGQLCFLPLPFCCTVPCELRSLWKPGQHNGEEQECQSVKKVRFFPRTLETKNHSHVHCHLLNVHLSIQHGVCAPIQGCPFSSFFHCFLLFLFSVFCVWKKCPGLLQPSNSKHWCI